MRPLPAERLAVTLLLTLIALLIACEGAPAAPSRLSSGDSASGVAESVAPEFSVTTGAGSRFLSTEHNGEVMVLYFSFPG